MSNAGAAPSYGSGSQSDPATESEGGSAAALRFLHHLATEVAGGTVELPCFPDVVLRVSLALADPKTTAERVVTIVGAEPRLSARILQTANSAAFNTSGKPLSDLRSAITRLGYQIVHGTAMSYAMQQIRHEATLKVLVRPLTDLWNRSIAVAAICQLLARRTRIRPDEAFLTGLLHGIGKLYIMVRAVSGSVVVANGDLTWLQMVTGWHASIGKEVLECWGFDRALCDAVGDQEDFERRWKNAPTLTDLLIASTVLADAIALPEPRVVTQGANAFISIGMTPADCQSLLAQADEQIRLVHEALA
jgi:HD-like signal output (HDOD) protein